MPGDSLTKTFSVENTRENKVQGYTIVLENVVNELSRREDLTYDLICILDEITLKGLFIPSSNESDRVCLFIPGCCGNFVDNDFILTISKILSNNNYNVLCANTRGSFMINSSFHPLNTERPKQIGTTFEKFEDSRYDIEAWIKYLDKLGYKNIDLICHSSGCNKVIYYFNTNMEGINNINNLVLLSPPDFVNRIKCY